jgi:hypothetical protein
MLQNRGSICQDIRSNIPNQILKLLRQLKGSNNVPKMARTMSDVSSAILIFDLPSIEATW